MKEKDYWKYFIKITGPYNERVHKRYKDCLVGNRPEMARALDSYGFADLMVSIKFHAALTYKLPPNNPLKFQLRTPTEAFKCLNRCWKMEPTLERVVEDIESWTYAVDKIIEARGAIVSGLALRHGHRWLRADEKGESVSRRTGRDRKDTFLGRPVHPDALPSLNRMIGEVDQALLLQAVVNFEEEVKLEANAQILNLEIDEVGDIDDDFDNQNDFI